MEGDLVSQTHVTRGVDVGPQKADYKNVPVVSTGCMLIAFLIVFLVLFVVPALIWTMGIVFGQ